MRDTRNTSQIKCPPVRVFTSRGNRSVAWAREVIERSRGWKWLWGRFDDLMMMPKGLSIRRTPGFWLLIRPWPFYFYFGAFTEDMMYEHLLDEDMGMWLSGQPEIIVRLMWTERLWRKQRWAERAV